MPPRGKFSKPSRGGGKRFSRDVQPVDKRGNPVGMWRDPEDDPSSSSEEDDESSSEESSSSGEEAGEGPSSSTGRAGAGAGAEAGPETEMTREERRAAARAKKEAAVARRKQMAAQPGDLPPSESEEDEEEEDVTGLGTANPNHTPKGRMQASKPLSADDGAEGEGKGKGKENGDLSQLSRREREAIEAQQARERYMKLHAEGKTEEARSDLARLAIVREQREAERARKEAEKEEKAGVARERAAARETDMKMKAATKGKKKGSKK